ncbi:uncharacterized protein EV420DRAFT_1622339 [Desarmillaria tabescens]|uniref:Uncharacterized protein n=1 Tax=Armillaria tabescens TaxID=1929756 RepID=A0AA39JRX6_ARMTA|nr:uncharacterized protein EV420DRAFT_1622339 [Desarmillaria tabescens]KAK0447805.1 hypothetical protein EV420DRAFT_1622339 [Desarmillaria tabescens]
MYVYRGSLFDSSYAVNEAITIVFPTDFCLGELVSAFWQWTKDAEGNEKVNVSYNGIIDSVTLAKKIGCSYDHYYRFDVTLAADFKSLTLMMCSPSNNTSATFTGTLQLSYSEPPFTPRCLVYVGKLDWLAYAKNEMLTVIVPSTFNEGDPVCVYWERNEFVTSMEILSESGDGKKQLGIPMNYYRFDGWVNSNRDAITLTMSTPSTPSTGKSNPVTLRLANDLMTRKKALIARYNVDIDGGINDVRDILVETLGFIPGNVEMLYYDVEPSGRPCKTLSGQAAPTAERFQQRFISLVKDTKPGDIRFVYVDAHVMSVERSFEDSEKGPAWKLAKADDGKQVEPVRGDWIADTLRQYLNAGANLTILCSSYPIGFYGNPPGVLLAAVHETQINIKAVLEKGGAKDPWTFAILREIEKTWRQKKRMPSYTQLVNDARLRINFMLQDGGLGRSYKGPSPDLRKPIAWQTGGPTEGYQDPQLVYNGWYIDADRAPFLGPFPVPMGQSLSPPQNLGPVRYPHDELKLY